MKKTARSKPKKKTSSSGADKKAPEARQLNDLFLFDSRSLLQLAAGSSVVIATLLSIPDGIALIPGATSVIPWGLQVIGIWVIGAVMWFVGFGAMVQLLRLISRGVIASDTGLKLSRFDRVIAWADIQAISLEPNPFFTRIFSLKEPARKLTVYFRFTNKNKLLANLLFPNFIPSFFFDRPTYDALVCAIFAKSGLQPTPALSQQLTDDYSVFAFRPEQIATVRRTCRWQSKQRVLVTCIIAFSLIVFLGRKAAVNYSFNSGLKAYREGRVDKAKEFYDLALKFDPTFAVAWNALGQCDFRLAETELRDFSRARKDWTIALLCKPDFVEPKLNLARLAIYGRNFYDAADYIERAIATDSQYALALVDKAELEIRRGKPAEGLKWARLVIGQTSADKGKGQNDELNFLAHCLVAQAKLDMGDLDGAALELKGFSDDPTDYNSGQNLAYMYIVKSRIYAAQGLYKDAQREALLAVHRQPRNEEALSQAVLVEVALGNYQMAQQYMAQARALLVPDPWLSIAYGRQLVKEGNIPDATHAYADALVIPNSSHDAISLAAIYREMSAVADAEKDKLEKMPELAAIIAEVKSEARGRALRINEHIFSYAVEKSN